MTDLPAYPLVGREFKIQYRETSCTFDVASSISSDTYTETGLRFLPQMICAKEGDLFETTTDILESLLLGHEVGGTAVCPASVFLELILEAARAILDVSATDILVTTDMRFWNSLVYMRSENPKKRSFRRLYEDKSISNARIDGDQYRCATACLVKTLYYFAARYGG